MRLIALVVGLWPLAAGLGRKTGAGACRPDLCHPERRRPALRWNCVLT